MSTSNSNPLASAAKRLVRIGTTLRVWAGSPQELIDFAPAIEREIERALQKGEEVEEGGVVRWIDTHELRDASRSGSAAYFWNGDRIKVERILCTRQKGAVTRQSLGFGWRKWGA